MVKNRQAEDAQKILDKRVRELRCLYDVASIAGSPDHSLQERMEQIIELLPRAFSDHGTIFARITYNSDEYISGVYQANLLRMSADIHVRGKKVGIIEIGFDFTPQESEDEAISQPDILLINAVAERLGNIITHRETEDKIRREQLRAQNYLDIAGTMLLALDSTGTVTMVNRKGCELLECDERDIIGKNWFESFLPRDIRKTVKSVFRELMNDNLKNFRDVDGHTILTCTGKKKIIQWHNSLVKDEEGTITGVLSSGQDVTERVRAEEALRESEEKFSKAFRVSPSMMTITTLEEGTFIEVNDSFIRYSGYSREELIGRTTLDIHRWIDPEERRSMLQMLETEGHVHNMDINSITKGGELRQGLLSAEIAQIGGQRYIITLINDVTEQRQNRKLLQIIYESSPLGIYIIQDDTLRYANPQFQKMTACTESELLGRKILDLVLPEDSSVILASMENSLESDHIFPCEFRLLGNNATPRWVVQSVTPIFYQGRQAVLGNLMDISQRKFLERKITEYEELDKMKSDLLATVSHELRTPLTTIKGYSTMILDYHARLEPEDMKDYLESIDNATDRLTRLVENLLDTSRMEAGLLQFEKRPVNIGQLVLEVAGEARLRTKAHEISVEVDRTLPRIPVDQRRIRQVLDNLVENAIKYSPQGEKIIISVKHICNEVRVSVSDKGSGIPSGELTNIFKSMYRLKQYGEKNIDGMGLGLYISQRLVEAHGGTIWAESPAGHGSIITFTLPDRRADNRAAAGTRKMSHTQHGEGNQSEPSPREEVSP